MMRKLTKAAFLLAFLCCFWTGVIQNTKAMEGAETGDYDFTDIQGVMDEVFGAEAPDFRTLVEGMVRGNTEVSFKAVGSWFLSACFYDVKVNQKSMVLLLGIGVIAAIFHNLSMAFSNQQIADTGFFITYLAFLTITMAAFYEAAKTVEGALRNLEGFMRALIPAFYMAVAFSTGGTTAVGFYQVTLIIISLANLVLLRLALPVIKISTLFTLLNHMAKEDFLSKLSDLFKTVVAWTLKGVLALVVGLNTLQGLVLPAVDEAKLSLVQKTLAMVPGIGNSADAAASLITNSGNLIKNGIGCAAFIFVAIMAAVPAAKVALFVLMYQVTCAVLQPVSDKRMVSALSGICDGAKLLLQVVITAGLLYLITIAIACTVTSWM